MSDFWKRKMKTYFNRIDFDKDGSITKKDFEGMGDRFIEVDKLDTKAGKTLKGKLVDIWDKYISAVAEKDKESEGISEESFIEAMGKLVKDPAMKDTLAGPLPIFFQAIDADGDGLIDVDEFKLFFRIFRLEESNAPSSFQAIDTDNDGKLTLDEFVTAGTDFFISETAACPTKLFWGPLV